MTTLEVLAIQASQLQQAAQTLRRAIEKHLTPNAHLSLNCAHLMTIESLANILKATLETAARWQSEDAKRAALTDADRVQAADATERN